MNDNSPSPIAFAIIITIALFVLMLFVEMIVADMNKNTAYREFGDIGRLQ